MARKAKDTNESALKFLERAAVTEDSRPVLTWGFYNGTHTATSDGFRLHVVAADLTDGNEWIEFKKSVYGSVAESETQTHGRYPDFGGIIPKRSTALMSATVNVEDMTRAVKRALVFARDCNYSVKLTFTPETIIVYGSSADRGEIETIVDAVYPYGYMPADGQPFVCAYNGQYIVDALNRDSDDNRIEILAYPDKLIVGDDHQFALMMAMGAGSDGDIRKRYRVTTPDGAPWQPTVWTGAPYVAPKKHARKSVKKQVERAPAVITETVLPATVETVIERNQWGNETGKHTATLTHERIEIRRGIAAFADVIAVTDVTAMFAVRCAATFERSAEIEAQKWADRKAAESARYPSRRPAAPVLDNEAILRAQIAQRAYSDTSSPVERSAALDAYQAQRETERREWISAANAPCVAPAGPTLATLRALMLEHNNASAEIDALNADYETARGRSNKQSMAAILEVLNARYVSRDDIWYEHETERRTFIQYLSRCTPLPLSELRKYADFVEPTSAATERVPSASELPTRAELHSSVLDQMAENDQRRYDSMKRANLIREFECQLAYGFRESIAAHGSIKATISTHGKMLIAVHSERGYMLEHNAAGLSLYEKQRESGASQVTSALIARYPGDLSSAEARSIIQAIAATVTQPPTPPEAPVRPFNARNDQAQFIARFRDTYGSSTRIHAAMTDGGACSLTTDFVRGGRYLRYAVLDTPDNRATVRTMGGTVSTEQAPARRSAAYDAALLEFNRAATA